MYLCAYLNENVEPKKTSVSCHILYSTSFICQRSQIHGLMAVVQQRYFRPVNYLHCFFKYQKQTEKLQPSHILRTHSNFTVVFIFFHLITCWKRISHFQTIKSIQGTPKDFCLDLCIWLQKLEKNILKVYEFTNCNMGFSMFLFCFFKTPNKV